MCVQPCSYVGAEARRRAARATWVRTLKNTYQADADGNLAIEAKFFVGSVPDKKQMDKIYVEQRVSQLRPQQLYMSTPFDAGVKCSGGRGFRTAATNVLTSAIPQTFQDLIVIDFHDGYSTLGEKVPLLYRETISRVNATYVMKVDDDTWVNVGVLPSVLARMKPTRTCVPSRGWWGRVWLWLCRVGGGGSARGVRGEEEEEGHAKDNCALTGTWG